ncbi:MAG: TonB-dependent receptor plug domain-containing protein [Opitutaceae bacterium]|nr:TonB-dependent receptor plug domain-containing protein [Opitutaceae bacterium]
MKPTLHTPAHRARQALAYGLAAMLTVTAASGQSADSDALRRLQEENAALRKQLAAMEGKAPAAAPAATSAQAPAAAQPSLAAEPVDPNTLVLSPFTVTSDKDYGYLKTNSSTATKIGMEIQKIPLSISVISEEFIKDTNMKDIQDVLRYQSSSAGDGRMGIIQPATGFTPSGIMTLRGFPINSRLRNGLLRYNAYTLDNVERVEVIKGPAAVFFGNAFPGGVINYVTKQPTFSKIPTSITYSYSGYDGRIGGERVTLDTNQVFSDKAAMRIVGAWDHGIGNARYEFQNGYSVNAGLTLNPLKSGRLKIFLEGEVLQRYRNQDDNSYIWPTAWLDDYKNPSANLLTLTGLTADAYRARIFNNVGQWIADKRNAANDQYLPLYTSVARGAYITDRSGNRVLDEKFNYYGAGTFTKDENATFSVVTDFQAASWLDLRHSYTTVQSRFDRVFSAANPYADGMRFNTGGVATQGYQIDAYYHQLDAVFKAKFAGIDNKFLLGGLYGETYNSFYGSNNHANLFPFYGYLPGAYDKPDEGYVSPIPAAFRHPVTGWGMDKQFIRSRTGQILTPQEIFSLYDPAVHISPDIRRITPVDRGLVDHSRPERKEWYVNWQGSMFDDRLTAFLGYREEKTSTVGQLVAANPPWFIVNDFALQNIPQADWVTYGLSPIFSRPRTTKGSSKMMGASFEVVKNISVYASVSQTFLPSGVTYLGGDYDPNAVNTRATLLGLSGATENARLVSQGGLTEVQNEKGLNMEFGVKVALDDNKIVGTASVFRVNRKNRVLDDTLRQFNEPLNYLLPNNQGGFSRIVRWYSASAEEENEGAEFEVIWTPKRNYQAVVSGSWIWRSETLADPSLALTPTSSAATRIQNEITFSSRLVNTPEFRFNVFQKYTFTDNFIGEHGRGFSIGLGTRYSSEMNIQNNVNMWTARGGLAAGDYLVFDTVLSYPFEVFGYKMSGTLNVSNITDKEYSEGNYNLAEPRSYMFTLGMKF